MTPHATELLARARQDLRDARQLETSLPRIAGREAYLAAFHAAQAVIYERTGRLAKTHRGVRSQFSRLAIDQPGLAAAGADVLGRGYEIKSRADYGVGTTAIVSTHTASATIEAAARFIDAVAALLADSR